jgi:hypothetical protein
VNLKSGLVSAEPPAGCCVIVVSGGVASTVNALSVTKCVPSFWSRSFQLPSLAEAKSGQGRVS